MSRSSTSTPSSTMTTTNSKGPKKRHASGHGFSGRHTAIARKRPGSTTFLASHSPGVGSGKPGEISQKSSSKSSSQGGQDGPSSVFLILQRAVLSGTIGTLGFFADVLCFSIIMLKKPIALVLTLWILALMATQLSKRIRTAFKPLCVIPGLARLPMCIVDLHPSKLDELIRADYPALMDIQTMTLEKLLDEAAGGSGVVYEIKRAEIATGDLLTLVRLSDLTARDILADTLVNFINTARLTGEGLQRLGTQVNGAVDS